MDEHSTPQALLRPDALLHSLPQLAGSRLMDRPKSVAALPILNPRKSEPGATTNVYPYSPLPNESSITVLQILPAEPKRSVAGDFSVDEEFHYPVKCCMKVVDLHSSERSNNGAAEMGLLKYRPDLGRPDGPATWEV